MLNVINIIVGYPTSVEQELEVLLNRLERLSIWKNNEEKIRVIKRVREVIEKTNLLKIVEKLRGSEEIASGTTNFESFLRSLAIYVKENLEAHR